MEQRSASQRATYSGRERARSGGFPFIAVAPADPPLPQGEEMKRYLITAAVALILSAAALIVGLNLNVRAIHKDAVAAEQSIAAMSTELDKFRAEFDGLARRVSVYQALSEGAREKLSGLEVWQITDIVLDYCSRNRDIGLTPSVLLAVWQQESGFNPMAVSNKDARGLGQLMWLTALPHLYDLGHVRPDKSILYNPVINAEVSIREIIRLRRYYLGIGVNGWMWPISSYYFGTGNIWKVIWYAHQVIQRQAAYQEKGVM